MREKVTPFYPGHGVVNPSRKPKAIDRHELRWDGKYQCQVIVDKKYEQRVSEKISEICLD